jgi:hypothetical protein
MGHHRSVVADIREDAAKLSYSGRDAKKVKACVRFGLNRAAIASDVSVADADVVKNISDCGDDACGQPSLSPDGRYVVYIRSPAR